MQFIDNTTSCSLVSDFIDWELEGFYKGAIISIEFDSVSVAGVVEEITGSTRQNLVLDSATRTNLLAEGITADECREEDSCR